MVLSKCQSPLSGFYLWPILIVAVGLLFCMPPFIFQQVRGLGGLLIPGLPVFTGGMILFISTLSDNWDLWSSVWPLELISLGLALLIMTFRMRQIWLGIPASIIGFNGLLLLFSATGLWFSLKFLWIIEPFFF